MRSKRPGLTDKPQRFRVIEGGPAGDGRPEGRSRVIYCMHCLSRGKLTKLL